MFNMKRENTSPVAILTLAGVTALSAAYLYLKNNGKIDDLRDRLEDIKDEIIDGIKGEELIKG